MARGEHSDERFIVHKNGRAPTSIPTKGDAFRRLQRQVLRGILPFR
jgi:hypothetical protein